MVTGTGIGYPGQSQYSPLYPEFAAADSRGWRYRERQGKGKGKEKEKEKEKENEKDHRL